MPLIAVNERISQDAMDALRPQLASGVRGPQDVPSDFAENYNAARQHQVNEGNLFSRASAFKPYLDERAKIINETTGLPVDLVNDPMNHYSLADFKDAATFKTYLRRGRIFIDQSGQPAATDEAARNWLDSNRTLARVELAKLQTAQARPGEFLNDGQILEKVRADLAGKRAQNQEIMRRGSGGGAIAGQFAGTAVGFMQDPIQAGTLLLGGGEAAGGSILANALKAFGKEAVLAGALQVPVEAQAFQFKQSIGSPYAAREAAFNVLAASVGAGVIRAAGSVTVDVAGKALVAYRERISAGKVAPTAESRQAEQVLQQYVDEVATHPAMPAEVKRSPVAQGVHDSIRGHFEALDKAAADINANEPVNVGGMMPDAIVHASERQIVPVESVELAYARLIPDAANTLSRGERKNLVVRLNDAEYKLAQIEKEQPSFTETYKRIARDLPPQLSAKARQGEAMRQAQKVLDSETATLRAEVEAIRGQLRLHDEANLSRKVLDQIDAKRKAGEPEAQIQQWMMENGHIKTATVDVKSAKPKTTDVPRGEPKPKPNKDAQGTDSVRVNTNPVTNAPEPITSVKPVTPAEGTVLPDPADVADILTEAQQLLEAQDVQIPKGNTQVIDGQMTVVRASARDEMTRLQRFMDTLDAIITCSGVR